MTEKRLSTVYDFSDLKLHPNGARVKQQARTRTARNTVQDARANWIATDAGGFAAVPKFRRTGSVAEVDERETMVSTEHGNGEDKQCMSKWADTRTLKRQKFMKNEDYLAEGRSASIVHARQADISDGFATSRSFSHPDPSPDLLKSIHRFAAEFYSERGQLLNSSRNYRKERKKRRQEKDAGSDANSSSSLGSESMGNQQKDEESDAEYSNETSVKTKRPKKGRHRVGQLYVDMYKVFDGSAMMALGMLVQEHIAHLVSPPVPVDWETEVHSAYSNPWGHTPPSMFSGTRTGDDEGAEPSLDANIVII